MSKKSGETIDWNRTPGKPSFSNNLPPSQSSFVGPGNWTEDMWGRGTNILGPQRASNKSWNSNPQESIDPSNAYLNTHIQNSSINQATTWNNTNSVTAPISNPFPVGIPLWGNSGSSLNLSTMRPIRGPQPQAQPINSVVDNRNSRQFSGWGAVENMTKDETYNNLDPINTNLISSAGSNASSSSNRNSKEPMKPESRITLLNEMLNNLSIPPGGSGSGDCTHSIELEEIIKSLININEAWGQRAVDQTTSWDISSINQDESQASGAASGATNQTGSTFPNQTSSNNTGVNVHSHQVSNNQNSQQQIQPQQSQQRRIKPMSHAITSASSGASGQMESNVWQNEPPNGTGIWEAHYESLGEKNSLEWASTGNSIHQTASVAINPMNNQKVPSMNRPVSFSNVNRQSHMGYRPQINNVVPGSAWNDLDSNVNIWNQHPDQMLVNSAGVNSNPNSARPINKVGSSFTSTLRGNNNPNTASSNSNALWPPTNQPPPGNDVYCPSTWNSQSPLNPIIGSDTRKLSNQAPGTNPGMWPPDYRSMIQHPPPTNSTSGGNVSSSGTGLGSLRNTTPGLHHSIQQSQQQQQQQNLSTMNNSTSYGFLRINVLRQLLKLGFSEEEIQTTMVENNMDIEKTVNEFRNKSAHIGLEALLNSIMGSNLFPVSSASPSLEGNPDFNKNANLLGDTMGMGGDDTKLNENVLTQQIVQWHMRCCEINQTMSKLRPSPSSPIFKELVQRREYCIQQMMGYEKQIKSLRSLNPQSLSGADDLSDRLSDLKMKQTTPNAWDVNSPWLKPPDMLGDVPGSGPSLAPGADRRWSNNDPVVISSVNNQQPINRQPWPSKSNPIGTTSNELAMKSSKCPTQWILMKNLQPHITIDVLKMTLNSILSEAFGSSTPISYELNPNMTARWCLLNLENSNQANHLMNHLLMSEGTSNLGTFEYLNESEMTQCIIEIKNLTAQVFGASGDQNLLNSHEDPESNEEVGVDLISANKNTKSCLDQGSSNKPVKNSPECQKQSINESSPKSQSPSPSHLEETSSPPSPPTSTPNE